MLEPGGRLGPYEVSGVLGKGGMGVVYRGVDTRLNRPVAIKTSDEQFSDRFNSEVRAIAALNHPNVCTLYDVGPNYLVMELLGGETLAARLGKGPLTPTEVIRYGSQIAGALAAAHAKGIVHRDLKPANVMLTTVGVKVLDFGIAKMTGPAIETVEATRGIIGTLEYMSPEQLAGGATDARSDIYALGLVLFEMATGKRFDRRADPMDSLSTLPDRPAHIIARCLAHDPEERWQSAGDVGHELEWAGRAPVTTAGAAAPGRSFAAGRALLAAAFGIIVLAALGMGSMRMFSGTAADPVARLESRTSIAVQAGLRLDSFAPLAVSPDGSRIAYVAINGNGERSLFLRPLASSSATELKGTTGAVHPFFSPDGRAIGYFADDALHRIGVDGGTPIRVCPLPGIDHGAAWGANDTIVVAIRGRGLFKVSASGGVLQPISEGLLGAWPSFLPDGVTILFSSFPEVLRRTVAISVVSLDGSGLRQIARLSDEDGTGAPVLGAAAEIQQAIVLPQGFLVFGQDPGVVRVLPIDPVALTPRGTSIAIASEVERGASSGGIAFAVSRSGLLVFGETGNKHQLVWVNRQGIISPLNTEPAAYRQPELSPDGRTIAISANDETRRPSLWLIDVERGTRSRFRVNGMMPAWMPGQRRIAFAGGGSPLTLAATDSDASESLVTIDDVRKAVPAGTSSYPTSWSPDGRYLLFEADNEDVFRVKLPERIIEPLLTGTANDWGARISPDGRAITFTSNSSGRPEVYIARWPGLEQRTAVSVKGGMRPRWSRDSNELFFWQGNTLMAARVSAELRAEVPRALFSGNFFGASRDSTFDVAADGRFLMVQSDERAQLTQITVLQDWIGGLKQ